MKDDGEQRAHGRRSGRDVPPQVALGRPPRFARPRCGGCGLHVATPRMTSASPAGPCKVIKRLRACERRASRDAATMKKMMIATALASRRSLSLTVGYRSLYA